MSIVYKVLGPTLRYHNIILYIADESSSSPDLGEVDYSERGCVENSKHLLLHFS